MTRIGWTPRRTLPVLACVAWGLTLGGCVSPKGHPLAQRPAEVWQAARVMPGEAWAADDARPYRIKRTGGYVLVREHSAGPDTGEAVTLHRVNLYPDDPVGFDLDFGKVVAVAGYERIPVEAGEGTHHVWYTLRPGADQAFGDALQLVGGLVLLTGLVVVRAMLEGDDADDDH
ncbi:MAG: hypothetical protein AAF800_08485 [Planctomycetota bacterium]